VQETDRLVHVGELALLTGSPRTATVRSPDRAELFTIQKPVFLDLMDSLPAFSRNLCLVLAKRLETTTLKVLAGEGAPHNVLVNGLLVGNIESNQWVVRHANEGKGRSMQDFYAEMGKRIPMGRVGTAQEFANMALFLASDAGSYVTGTAINIDGGLTPVV
jgi:enoyl-[acyl-carrier-protein] reductase (NADH)